MMSLKRGIEVRLLEMKDTKWIEKWVSKQQRTLKSAGNGVFDFTSTS